MTTTTSPPQTTPEKSPQPLADRWQLSEWQRPLPKKVLRQFRDGSPEETWTAWVQHLSSRKNPASLRKLLPARQSPLIWSTVISLQTEETVNLVQMLQGSGRKKDGGSEEILHLLSAWLEDANTRTIDSCYALECVAWAWSLADLSTHCPEALWWRLQDRLIQNAANSCQLNVTNQPLCTVLLGGELPLVLAHFFPEQKVTAELQGLAITSLSESLTELLDGEGMPSAAHLLLLRPLLGSWTRCRAIMAKQRKLVWSDDAETQYRWLVTQSLRMSRPGGGMVLNGSTSGVEIRDLFQAALQLGGNETDAVAAACLLGSRKVSEGVTNKQLSPAYNSEWSALAVLRNKWSHKARQVAVSYADGQNRLEFCHGSSVALAGNWQFTIVCNGHKVQQDPKAEWDEVAWESDNDLDYLELEMEVAPNIRLQRSFLLAREDQFLILADAVLCDEPESLEYRSRLPLGDKITIHPASDTREMTLKSPRPVAQVLPLWLPEWRSGKNSGLLDIQQHQIVMEHSGRGRLFTPLFFDLSPKRFSRPLTWRQLAVGHNRKNVTRDEAVGYRVQIGSEQWLMYRSLTESLNRTVLGQNLMCELHVSRFLETGDVEELIEVQ